MKRPESADRDLPCKPALAIARAVRAAAA